MCSVLMNLTFLLYTLVCVALCASVCSLFVSHAIFTPFIHFLSHLFHRSSPSCLNRYGQVASIIGTSCIFVAFAIYDHANLLPFRTLTLSVAFLSWVLLRYSGTHACAVTPADTKDDSDLKHIETGSSGDKDSSSKHQPRSNYSFVEVALQVARNPSFLTFVAMNFLQVFDVTVSAGFFVIYERHLLGDNAWPAFARVFVIGCSFLLPQVFVFSVTPLVARIGSYKVIM